MGRSIRIGIDQLAGYALLVIDPEEPIPAVEDDFYELTYSTPFEFAEGYPFDTITVWGTGLVSFGPATEAQRAFMANLGTSTDLSAFPGDYVAIGFSAEQYGFIELIDGNLALTGPWISAGAGLEISEEGLHLSGVDSADSQVGWRIGSDVNSGDGTFFWSDLNVTVGTNAGETLTGTPFAETLQGLGGNDTLIGGDGADALDGGQGNDVLIGGAGLERLWGGNGNDILDPGTDFRLVDGGKGFDRLVLDYSASDTSLVLDATELLARPDVTGIEAVDITGTDYVDVITGSANNDTLHGGGSYDLLIGGDGNDLLDAGPAGASLVGELPDGGLTTADALPLDYLFTDGLDGGTVSATVTYVPSRLPGGGDDTGVYAFTVAEAGAHMWLDWTIVGASSGGSASFTLTVVDANGVEVDRGTYDPAVPYVFPHAGTYYLTGSLFSGSSWEYGFLDLDLTLEGALVLSSNRLVGGNGNDTYVVHSPTDQVIEEAGGGTDTVLSGVSFVLPDHVERLTLTGNAAVDGTGNDLANVLTGNAAANRLEGGDGSDRLTGAGGADIFVAGISELGTSRAGEHDVFVDFRSGTDKIDLSALYEGVAFGGLLSGKASQAAGLDGFQALTFTDKGKTWLVVDTDGIAGADFAVEFGQQVTLQQGDLIVSSSASSAGLLEGRHLDLAGDMPQPHDLFWF